MMFSIAFNNELFLNYLKELQHHLFDEMKIEDIIKNVMHDHRSDRFVSMYMLKDKETFDRFYQSQSEWGISSIVNRVIATLLHNTQEDPFKIHLVETLSLKPEMVDGEVSSIEMKITMKDLNAFRTYAMKRSGVFGERE